MRLCRCETSSDVTNTGLNAGSKCMSASEMIGLFLMSRLEKLRHDVTTIIDRVTERAQYDHEKLKDELAVGDHRLNIIKLC